MYRAGGAGETEDDTYYLTYKSRGKLAREEYNLPLTKEAYEHLIGKADGNILTKKRYLIPVEGSHLTIEFDVLKGSFRGLCWRKWSLRRRRRRMRLFLRNGLEGM